MHGLGRVRPCGPLCRYVSAPETALTRGAVSRETATHRRPAALKSNLAVFAASSTISPGRALGGSVSRETADDNGACRVRPRFSTKQSMHRQHRDSASTATANVRRHLAINFSHCPCQAAKRRPEVGGVSARKPTVFHVKPPAFRVAFVPRDPARRRKQRADQFQRERLSATAPVVRTHLTWWGAVSRETSPANWKDSCNNAARTQDGCGGRSGTFLVA